MLMLVNYLLLKLNNGHCPFIVELKENKKAVVTKISPKKEYIVFDDESSKKV